VNKLRIKVDVVSDVVCPWCYIGKRRLERAIQAVSNDVDVEVRHLPFELNANIPAEGLDQKEYLAAKFGGTDRFEQLTNHVASVARGEGLNFDFGKQEVMPNTINAHRLIQLATGSGNQDAVVEAFMKAYFEEGADLSKNENLIAIAAGAGLNKEEAEALLEGNSDVGSIRQMESMSQQRGISGVPFFIINDKYGISGAQPSETLAQIFREVGNEVQQAEALSCEPDKKNC
jgi:predicted DsbA family dithiol-disulfide isomerase